MAQVGSTTCTLCPKNSYQDTEGQAECKQCETVSTIFDCNLVLISPDNDQFYGLRSEF